MHKRKRSWLIKGVWGKEPLPLPLHLTKKRKLSKEEWFFVVLVGFTLGFFFSGLFLVS